jgi:hypothetical protein
MKKLILLCIIPLFLSSSGQTEQEKKKFTIDDWKKYSMDIQNIFNRIVRSLRESAAKN